MSWRPTAGLQALLGLLEDDRQDDDGALDHRLPEGGDADEHEPVGEEADDEGAHDGADDGAAAAAQGGATEDGGGDGVELVGRGRVGVGGAELGGEQHARQGGAGAADDVDGDGDPRDADAGEHARRGRCRPRRRPGDRRASSSVTTTARTATASMIQTATGMPNQLVDADDGNPGCRGPRFRRGRGTCRRCCAAGPRPGRRRACRGSR